MILPVGNQYTVVIIAVRMDFRTFCHRKGIIDSVNTDTHSAFTVSKNIAGLGDIVMGTVNVQAHPHDRMIIAINVCAIFSRRISLGIGKRQAVSINRAPIEIFPVNGVAHILQSRQLYLHKIHIASVILVAHHASRQFQMTELRSPFP